MSIQLNKDDTLLFNTDGVVDAQDENEDFFCDDRLIQSAMKNDPVSAEIIQEQIMESLKTFVGDADQC
ncbi:MAG TPA: SpoIIE family protein phosphatase [Anaerolineales bacterium]|nr:SpoIIE family protein phosphatase [Anaerolineales bacterium]